MTREGSVWTENNSPVPPGQPTDIPREMVDGVRFEQRYDWVCICDDIFVSVMYNIDRIAGTVAVFRCQNPPPTLLVYVPLPHDLEIWYVQHRYSRCHELMDHNTRVP